jgi:hypothetical protein
MGKSYGSLTKKQMTILDSHAGVFDWDDLPEKARKQIEAIRDHETTWSDAQRYLGDIYNPHLCGGR